MWAGEIGGQMETNWTSGYAARRGRHVCVGSPMTGGVGVGMPGSLSGSGQTPFANARHTGHATNATDVTPGTLVTTGIL